MRERKILPKGHSYNARLTDKFGHEREVGTVLVHDAESANCLDFGVARFTIFQLTRDLTDQRTHSDEKLTYWRRNIVDLIDGCGMQKKGRAATGGVTGQRRYRH